MAVCYTFICDSCGHQQGAWSDGNPYFIDESGAKQYAYHPNHYLLAKCIGNDVPHLCLGCGESFNVDTREPVKACPKCDAADICDSNSLEGKQCPQCKSGLFGSGIQTCIS